MSAPRKYDQETRDRAVRMYQDRLAEGGISQLKAREEVGGLLDIDQSTLRNWIRQQESESPAATTVSGDTEMLERTLQRTLVVEVSAMTAVSATWARANLYRLIDQVNEDSEPLTITGQRGNAVLVGEEDWLAIQETLFLASVPGLAESIRHARAEGIDAGSAELDW